MTLVTVSHIKLNNHHKLNNHSNYHLKQIQQQHQQATERVLDGNNNEEGPERCQMCCLGPRCVFSPFIPVFLNTNLCFIVYTGLIYEIDDMESDGWR